MYAAGCTLFAVGLRDRSEEFVEDGFEKLALPLRKDEVSGFRHAPLFAKGSGSHTRFWGRVHAINARRGEPASKSLKGPHCTGHTLAICDAALSPNINLQDRLSQILVANDRDIRFREIGKSVEPTVAQRCLQALA